MKLPVRLVVLDGWAMRPRSSTPEMAVNHCRGLRQSLDNHIHLFPQYIRLDPGFGSVWYISDRLEMKR